MVTLFDNGILLEAEHPSQTTLAQDVLYGIFKDSSKFLHSKSCLYSTCEEIKIIINTYIVDIFDILFLDAKASNMASVEDNFRGNNCVYNCKEEPFFVGQKDIRPILITE